MKPGDIAFFLANQQLHKLDIDRTTPDPTQIVLTFWTDQASMAYANPSAHPDFHPASSLSADVLEQCYVVEPDSDDD
ncbi:hypothetical protein CC86DRAFT_113225 [Ophiobolus disseminans]|uniref:Uncharacterized protein n=1 Tax=Ophiobolus disseminans TaxID=1469910 RepID=A0A6A6ZKQ3_9PLEO|nr:hypothetical protein CC86DRAFT_113225 [Ophiobolus disseminans]